MIHSMFRHVFVIIHDWAWLRDLVHEFSSSRGSVEFPRGERLSSISPGAGLTEPHHSGNEQTYFWFDGLPCVALYLSATRTCAQRLSKYRTPLLCDCFLACQSISIRSFPSGHASESMAGMAYVTLLCWADLTRHTYGGRQGWRRTLLVRDVRHDGIAVSGVDAGLLDPVGGHVQC